MCIAPVACTPEAPQPVAGEWERIFSITPPELMRYGRAYTVDTLYFRRIDSAAGTSGPDRTGSANAIPGMRAGLLEFSRGQTPDGLQAEQRGFLYNTTDAFRLLRDEGLYTNRETNLRAPADSARFRFSGQPASGFLLQDRDGLYTMVAPPLTLVRDRQLGLARYEVYAGRVELRGASGPTAPAMLVFQRLYLPAANPFDENARRLWASRARLWLTVQDEEGAYGGDIFFAREGGSVLKPLFAAGDDSAESFAFLMRPAGSSNSDAQLEVFSAAMSLESAESGAQFRGSFALEASGESRETGAVDRATRCEFRLSALHTAELFSISRAASRAAAMRGEYECPRRDYRLQGMLRVWPEEDEE